MIVPFLKSMTAKYISQNYCSGQKMRQTAGGGLYRTSLLSSVHEVNYPSDTCIVQASEGEHLPN